MSISIKNPEQIEKMRIAGKLAASVLEMIGVHVKVGVTTEKLDHSTELRPISMKLDTAGKSSIPNSGSLSYLPPWWWNYSCTCQINTK